MRFKNWVFFNERLSMVGEDQAVMKREDERYQIKSADVRFVYLFNRKRTPVIAASETRRLTGDELRTGPVRVTKAWLEKCGEPYHNTN